MTERAVWAPPEKSFQGTIVSLAELLGWRVYHTYDSRRSNAGFPDLVLVRRGRLVFAELKATGGRMRRGQVAWLQELAEVAELSSSVDVYSWRPEDWPEIQEALR